MEFTSVKKASKTSGTGRVRYLAGLLYPHLDNLWFFQPNVPSLEKDFGATPNRSFYWNEFDSNETHFVSLSENHYQVRQRFSIENLTCSRMGLLIVSENSQTKKWSLLFRISSYELGSSDCQLGELPEPIVG
jgi:hypothetical protein